MIDWDLTIDELKRWLSDPATVEVEDAIPPSRVVILEAIKLAEGWKKEKLLSPFRVVPDLEGGIVFERRCKEIYETITLNAYNELEIDKYENSKLTRRRKL